MTMIKLFQASTSLGSDNAGTEQAPEYILNASLRDGLRHNSLEFVESGSFEALGSNSPKKSVLRNKTDLVDFNKQLYQAITQNTDQADIALTLGGDHSIAIGTMFATRQRYSDAKLVYIDAHPDCTSPHNTLTGNIHGMPVSTVLGDGLYDEFELGKYNYADVNMIGLKDIDPTEQTYLSDNNIFYLTMDDIIRRGIAECAANIVKRAGGSPLHIGLDIDSIDVSEAPATGILNKGGLSYREISYLCRQLAECNIVGIDLVEINPSRDIEDKTTYLGSELIVTLLGGNWDTYTRYIESQKKRQA